MLDNLIKRKIFILGILLSVFFPVSVIFASETIGTIDTNYKYAWGENLGWLNFGCAGCNVVITDTTISGNAWSRQYGWINLAPTNSGVVNTSGGVLSGYAWGSNIGWINFTGVTINSGGEFIGYATVKKDNSQINFNCANGNTCSEADFKVKTDWRPLSARTSPPSGGGGGRWVPPIPVVPPVAPPAIPPEDANPLVSVIKKIIDYFKPINETINVAVEVPRIAPISFKTQWNLLPVEAIRRFVFAPLPNEVRTLASKFPELANTFKNVGVDRLTDLDRLTGVTFNIQGLAELEKTVKAVGVEKLKDIDKLKGVGLNVPGFSGENGKIVGNVSTGKISLLKGLPVNNFPLVAKNNLPSEFVFARTAGELVDLNVAISVGDKGEVTQKISSLPGKTLKLVVKPISKARSVTGYFVFKSSTPRISKNEILRSSLTASALFSMNDLVETNPEPISVENKLVLSSFEYTDPDHDGIYTADVVSPVVPGEYEVITVIEYVDPTLGIRQMRMITVIDPEGYVFEKNNGKETRIPSAIVSLYVLNFDTKKYELWNAKDYQQENPQVTDVRGTYSFLVPEGSYYFDVEAPGYDHYTSKVFVVKEGSGIHQNIELNSGLPFINELDWKTLLLIVVFLLLVYNLYRNRERDRLLKSLNKNDGK